MVIFHGNLSLIIQVCFWTRSVVQIMIRTLIKAGLENFELDIIDMEKGGSKTYSYAVQKDETCIVNNTEYNWYVPEI